MGVPLIVMLAVGAVLLVWLLLHIAMHKRRSGKPAVIAHRGAAGRAPENTLAGVEAGVTSGARFIEIDVQRSTDGVLVLMHDVTVDRTTDGSGRVSEMSYGAISQLDAGSWYSDSFAGERVPRLDQVLELLSGWSGTLVVEAKFPELYPGIAADLVSLFERFSGVSVSSVSFDHDWLAELHRLAPSVPLARLWVYPRDLSRADGIVRIGVFWPSVVLDPTLRLRAAAQGLETWIYTADHALLKHLLAWLGVDGITTNFP